MLLVNRKRPLPALALDATKPKKTRKAKAKKKQSATTMSSAQLEASLVADLGASIRALDDKCVFRPAAHLKRSDISFISGDRKAGYALHSFLLKLR